MGRNTKYRSISQKKRLARLPKSFRNSNINCSPSFLSFRLSAYHQPQRPQQRHSPVGTSSSRSLSGPPRRSGSTSTARDRAEVVQRKTRPPQNRKEFLESRIRPQLKKVFVVYVYSKVPVRPVLKNALKELKLSRCHKSMS